MNTSFLRKLSVGFTFNYVKSFKTIGWFAIECPNKLKKPHCFESSGWVLIQGENNEPA